MNFMSSKWKTVNKLVFEALCIRMSKVDTTTQKIFFRLVFVFILGLALSVFGAITSGAGHGPYPVLSIYVCLMGVALSVISLILALVYAIMPKSVIKKIFEDRPPSYRWVCPECDQVNEKYIGQCESCDYHT